MGITLKSKQYFAISLAIIVIVSTITIIKIIPRSVAYSDLQLTSSDALIGTYKQMSTTTKLTTYRLLDGKTEDFNGTWRGVFGSPAEIILFGSQVSHPEDQYMVVLNTKSGTIKDISQLPGHILDMTVSPDNEWLLLTGIKKVAAGAPESHYICTSRKDKKKLDDCVMIPGTVIPAEEKAKAKIFTAYWDTQKASTLRITPVDSHIDSQTEAASWSYIPDTGVLEKSNQRFALLPDNSKVTGPMNIKRFGPITWIQYSSPLNKNRSLFWINSQTKIIPVTDTVVALRQPNSLAILNLQKNTMSWLIKDGTDQEKLADVFTFYRPQQPAQ